MAAWACTSLTNPTPLSPIHHARGATPGAGVKETIRDSVLMRMEKTNSKAMLSHLIPIAAFGYILCGSSFILIVPIELLEMKPHQLFLVTSALLLPPLLQ